MATSFMLVKYVSDSGIALPEILFWRQFMAIPFLLLVVTARQELQKLKTKRIVSHTRRGVIGMMGMFCNLAAVTLLPLAESTTFSFTAPLFAVLIAAFFLGERVGVRRWSAVLVGSIGVVMITQPGEVSLPVLGVIAGLASGLLNAIISHLIHDLGKTESAMSVVFWFAVIGTMAMLPFLPFYYSSHSGSQWILLILTGIVGTLGQLLMTEALKLGSVASVIVVDYSMLIWATLYGAVIWHTIPPSTTWIGAPLIVGASIIVALRQPRRAEKKPE